MIAQTVTGERVMDKRTNVQSLAFADARAFVIDTVVVAITQMLLKLRALVTLPLIVKLLGTEQYGIWAQTLVLIGFLGIAFSVNLHLPLVRFIAADRTQSRRVYGTLASATLASALGGGFLIYLFADTWGRLLLSGENLAPYVRVSVFLMLFGNLRLLNLNVYRATDRLKLRSVVELVTTSGELVGIYLLLWHGYGLLQVFLFMAVWEGAVVILLTCHIVTVIGWGMPEWRILVDALRYALPIIPTAFSQWILDRSDRFVIGYYLGAAAIGIYSANYALASLLMLFQTPFQMTLLSKVAALWDSNREGVRKYISLANKAFLTLAIPFVFGMPVLARGFLARFGNAEIATASGTITFLIALGVLFWGVSIMQIQIFYGAKRTGYVGSVTIIAALVNLVLNLLLVPSFGMSGAALATLISYAGLCLVYVWRSHNIMKLDFYGKYLLKCCIAALMMAIVLHWLSPSHTATLFEAGLVGGIVYFSVLLGLRAFAPSELELMCSFLRAPFWISKWKITDEQS
ncbi:MAG: polysaccharide biosynthesis C-terminal domain-containing protein [Deltaproteobacteria bacterium]|nr:polysaccharide biosynthesis C-terminal domain-containing protein [Deltaproteobacteria bacterium]